MKIRKTTEDDLPAIHACNEAAIPHVNSIRMEDLQWYMNHCRHFLTIEEQDKVAGFMIVLGPGLPYESLNYRFFNAHYANFDYVDRIVIDTPFRGQHYGTALYQYLF